MPNKPNNHFTPKKQMGGPNAELFKDKKKQAQDREKLRDAIRQANGGK